LNLNFEDTCVLSSSTIRNSLIIHRVPAYILAFYLVIRLSAIKLSRSTGPEAGPGPGSDRDWDQDKIPVQQNPGLQPYLCYKIRFMIYDWHMAISS